MRNGEYFAFNIYLKSTIKSTEGIKLNFRLSKLKVEPDRDLIKSVFKVRD